VGLKSLYEVEKEKTQTQDILTNTEIAMTSQEFPEAKRKPFLILYTKTNTKWNKSLKIEMTKL
jgi:hypothetical protein